MFFGQKIHPLNFDGPDRLTVDADAVELSGANVRLWVRCAEIATGCLRLRFENERVTDGRQHSDAVLPELRAGQAIMPRLERDTAVFAATARRVELDATRLRLELAELLARNKDAKPAQP